MDYRQPLVDMTTRGCHIGLMVKQAEYPEQAELLDELRRVRDAAIEHVRAAQELARQRRRLIDALLAEGLSQADLAREHALLDRQTTGGASAQLPLPFDPNRPRTDAHDVIKPGIRSIRKP